MGLGECLLILAFAFAIINCLVLLGFACLDDGLMNKFLQVFCFNLFLHLILVLHLSYFVFRVVTCLNQVINLGIELALPQLIR